MIHCLLDKTKQGSEEGLTIPGSEILQSQFLRIFIERILFKCSKQQKLFNSANVYWASVMVNCTSQLGWAMVPKHVVKHDSGCSCEDASGWG